MLWVYGHHKYFYSYNAGINFKNVIIWRQKTSKIERCNINNNNIHLYGAISNLKLLFGATNKNVNTQDQLGTLRCKIIESLQVCDTEQMAF